MRGIPMKLKPVLVDLPFLRGTLNTTLHVTIGLALCFGVYYL